MRELKFRAWVKDPGVMVTQSNCAMGLVMVSNGDGFGLVQDQQWTDRKDFEIMQFTGVKDVNGKEIFEGDILFSEDWNPKCQEVTFDRGGFCLKYDESGYYPDIKYAERMAIVGNIHENPELLKP